MGDQPKQHQVFCDESQTSGARFVVYGGMILPGKNLEWFDALMTKWRTANNMHSELKWTKVTSQKYGEYCSLVDLFFEHALLNRLHFKAVVFDSHEIDYKTYHEGDEELGFYKFYYQFLLHKFGVYATDDDHRLYVNIDERSTKYKLSQLKDVLNAGIQKKHGRKVDVVRQVEPRDSKKSNLLQVSDVLMGAIGWEANDLGDRPEARQSKKDLAAYIAAKAKLASLKVGTPWGMRYFEIWRFRFSKPHRKGKK